MTFPFSATINEPLTEAWWIPGFTAQSPGYIYASNPFLAYGPGFPNGLTFVTVNGNYFDTSGNPLSGYLTFWPSSDLTFDINGAFTYMPQRFAGLNFSLIGVNQMGDGKIYLEHGRLNVSLLATDNLNMTPNTFTYHVRENFQGGMQYDIAVPSSLATAAQDIRSLIIPGSIQPVTDIEYDDIDVTNISSQSTQYVVANVTGLLPSGVPINLTPYPVSFAFLEGQGVPTPTTTWTTGSWQANNIAQVLIGPGAGALRLAIGMYRIWVKIDATPQVPVIPVGFLNIY